MPLPPLLLPQGLLLFPSLIMLLSALLLLLLPSSYSVVSETTYGDEPCTLKHPDTQDLYDLRPLIRNEGQTDWVVEATQDNSTRRFHLNVCRDILYNDTGLPASHTPAAYQEAGEGEGGTAAHGLGQVSRKPFLRDGRLYLRYTGGDLCRGGGQARRSTLIAFLCDPSAPEDQGPRLISADDGCAYWFEWRHASVCPGFSGYRSSGRTWFGFFSTM